MKIFLAILALVTVLLALYVVIIRPRIRDKPWAQGFFKTIEPIEIKLWSKSESILWARFLQVLGVLLTFLAQIGQFDMTPFMPFIPDRYKWIPALLPLIVTAAGVINEALRKDVTTPLAVVAMPSDAPPAAKAAVTKAEVATEKAVVAVEAAEAKAKE